MLELQGFELSSRWSAGIEDGGVGEAHAEAPRRKLFGGQRRVALPWQAMGRVLIAFLQWD